VELEGGDFIHMARDADAVPEVEGAQVVDAVGLVGMLVRQEHRIDVVDIGIDELLAQVGRGVDHDTRGAVA